MDKEVPPPTSNEENGAVSKVHQDSDDYDPNQIRDQPSSSTNENRKSFFFSAV